MHIKLPTHRSTEKRIHIGLFFKEVARGGKRTLVLSISFIFSLFTTLPLSHSGSPTYKPLGHSNQQSSDPAAVALTIAPLRHQGNDVLPFEFCDQKRLCEIS
jgi:hypothetical protein